MKAEQDALFAWKALIEGRAVNRDAFQLIDGRIDIRGLVLPTASVESRIDLPVATLEKTRQPVRIANAKWNSIDFTSSFISNLKFEDCEFTNCVFDSCDCTNWGIWSSKLTECSFVEAKLRGAVMGGLTNRRLRNEFVGVNFSSTDLRGSYWPAGKVFRCLFDGTKLDRVEFGSVEFVDCRFLGPLNSTIFYRTGFDGQEFPPNDLLNVDFSDATLSMVAFRGPSLVTTKFPNDSDHVVIENLPRALATLIYLVKQQKSSGWRAVEAILMQIDKWRGHFQKRYVLNMRDMQEYVGQDGLRIFVDMLKQSQAKRR